MKKIIYYVATSIDGYIAGENDDVSQFLYQGKGVDQYKADLAAFQTIIMGRKTYEIGYAYGLKPGQAAYQGMEHHIFSDNLVFESSDDNVHVEKVDLNRIKELKENSPTDIYLCGGGMFAEWLLKHNQVDCLKVKLNPITLGKGTKLFGDSSGTAKWELTDSEVYEDGMVILSYGKTGG